MGNTASAGRLILFHCFSCLSESQHNSSYKLRKFSPPYIQTIHTHTHTHTSFILFDVVNCPQETHVTMNAKQSPTPSAKFHLLFCLCKPLKCCSGAVTKSSVALEVLSRKWTWSPSTRSIAQVRMRRSGFETPDVSFH